MPRRLVILFCFILTGCNAVLNKSFPPSALPSAQYILLPATMPANLARQNCGAQALGAAAASLRPPGIEFPPALLHTWDHDGATPLDILIVARSYGFLAELESGQWPKLLTMIDSNDRKRVLVEFDSTIEVWTPFGFFRRPRSQSMYHWSMVDGYAKDGSAVVLAAPGGRDYIIPRDSFMRRWLRADDCLITVAAPP